MATINVNLISGRSIQQGVAIEGGKEKPAYRTAAGIIELDPSDLKKLGTWKNTNVRVTSDYGSVIVKAIETTQGPHPGLGFIPMGPWANSIINPNTYSYGYADIQRCSCEGRGRDQRTGSARNRTRAETMRGEMK